MAGNGRLGQARKGQARLGMAGCGEERQARKRREVALVADRVARAASAERRRAEQALKAHMAICLSCNRQSKGIPENQAVQCDTGWRLQEHLALMQRQVEVLQEDDGWVQDQLWLAAERYGRHGAATLGVAGMAWHGLGRCGPEWQARLGKAGLGWAWLGVAGADR